MFAPEPGTSLTRAFAKPDFKLTSLINDYESVFELVFLVMIDDSGVDGDAGWKYTPAPGTSLTRAATKTDFYDDSGDSVIIYDSCAGGGSGGMFMILHILLYILLNFLPQTVDLSVRSVVSVVCYLRLEKLSWSMISMMMRMIRMMTRTRMRTRMVMTTLEFAAKCS